MDQKSQNNLKLEHRLTLSVLVVLFSGNVYFVKKLVDKVESNEVIMFSLRQEVAVLNARFDTLAQVTRNYDRHVQAGRDEAAK